MITKIDEPSDEFARLNYKLIELEAYVEILKRELIKVMSELHDRFYRKPDENIPPGFGGMIFDDRRALQRVLLFRLKKENTPLYEAILRTLSDDDWIFLGLS